MLVIRLQRTGRKGHAMFRVVVQDSRRTPSSGKVVAWLGSYDPHAKVFNIDKEKAATYLEHGAQPSPRVTSLLAAEGVKLPDWVTAKTAKTKSVRNPEKRRSTTPAEEAPVEETPTEEVEAPIEEEAITEAPAEVEALAEETPAAEVATEAPSESAEAESEEPETETES
jgi:small subunit ribosomal protein S16